MLVGEFRHGRRWAMQGITEDGKTWWCAWRLFERVEGLAWSEEGAEAAIEHFLSVPTSYSLT